MGWTHTPPLGDSLTMLLPFASPCQESGHTITEQFRAYGKTEQKTSASCPQPVSPPLGLGPMQQVGATNPPCNPGGPQTEPPLLASSLLCLLSTFNLGTPFSSKVADF